MELDADASEYIVDAIETTHPMKTALHDASYISDPGGKAGVIMHQVPECMETILAKQLETGRHEAPFYAGFIDPETHTPGGWGVCCFPDNDTAIVGNFKGNLENASDSVVTCKSTSLKAHGEIQNNNLNGFCTIHVDGHPFYEGEITANEFNGSGRIMSSIYQYSGQFRNSKRNGLGELVHGNKKYIGMFANDCPHGAGRLYVDKDGGNVEILNGSFVEGKPHGECVLIDSNNSKWYIVLDNGKVIEKITAHEKERIDLKVEVDRLKKLVDDKPDVCSCIVCNNAQSNTVIPECGHVCICVDCERRLTHKTCPYCRARYSRVVVLKYVS